MLEGLIDAKIRPPEFEGIKAWINSKPLTLKALRGKVVLIDFWAYTCINCVRTIPYLKKWHEKYARKGLVIIGVHAPEFTFEKDAGNVKREVTELGIGYPVAVDSDMRTWNAFGNQYWPSTFIIDKEGFVAYVHHGEGSYAATEAWIQLALGVSGKTEKDKPLDYMFDQSPETYAGLRRNYGLGSGLVCDRKGCGRYVDPGEHLLNTIYPDGEWVQGKECLELRSAPGRLTYRFVAREVNIVMEPVKKSAKAQIIIDGRKKGSVTIDRPTMYNVFKDKSYSDRTLQAVFDAPVRVYVYTFG